MSAGRLVVRMVGPPPIPDTDGLAAALEAQGIDASMVTVELVPRETVSLAEPDG